MAVKPYKAYTTEFDRVVDARDLPPRGNDHDLWETPSMRPELLDIEASAPDQESIGEIAEGEVVLLLDLSGSTRLMARELHRLVDSLSLALEGKGVPFQVLGFTTSTWKGGESRKKWLADGRPYDPGRLCDILHVVIKDRDTPWTAEIDGKASPRAASENVIHKKFLKENVDGEAVRWAISRMADPANSRLVHIGDGQPVDDSTISHNDRDILTEDYRKAVSEAKASGIALTFVNVDSALARRQSEDTYSGSPDGLDFTDAFDPAKAARRVLETIAPLPVPTAAP